MRSSFAAGLAALGLLLSGAAPAPAPPVDAALLLDAPPAPTLSAYRLFTDDCGRRPNVGLTPYALNTPLFSDYAQKRRYLFLPPGAHAVYRAQGVLDLPVGAVLVKTFAYPADLRRPSESLRFIETRLLIHRAAGWVPLTYVWNDTQTEAVLKRAGAHAEVAFVDVKEKTFAFGMQCRTLINARSATLSGQLSRRSDRRRAISTATTPLRRGREPAFALDT